MALRQLPADFKDFLSLLNKHSVKYLLLGGWAVGIYGSPRATADMDLLIATDDNNLKVLKKALKEFGVPEIDMNHFKIKGNVFRMGRSPIRIELINEISGTNINECYQRRRIFKIEDTDVSVISRNDLIINKKASARAKDIADVENLEKTE